MPARQPASLFILVAAILIAGSIAAPAESASCPLDTRPMLVAELFMGRDIDGGGHVSDAEWEGFVADSLGHYFPDGFTVLDAEGAWRDPRTGKTSHEDTKLVEVAAPDSPATQDALTHVMQDYKTRFHQQSVGLLLQNRCGAF